jgi:uncharacterized protein (TIGR04551 family)
MKPLVTMWSTLGCLALPHLAHAEAGFETLGRHLGDRVDRFVVWEGDFRIRSNLFYNLDLDRGPTPSGDLFFPVPLSDPKAQVLTGLDMRLRSDLTFVAPNGGIAAHLRFDLFDDMSLGSAPNGPPAAATGQSPDSAVLTIKRAWAEVLTPFGVLAAGRMGSHWGMGLLTHGGDDPDSDSGDAADRIAFSTPLFGLVWSLAYDLTATGPSVERHQKTIDLDPTDDVRTLTFAVLRYHDDLAHRRRLRADKATLDLGTYLSYRTQDNDVPSTYTPSTTSPPLDLRQVVPRGFAALAADLWLRMVHPSFELEFEGCYLHARYDEASLIPGVSLREDITADQWGFALRSRFGKPARTQDDIGGLTFGLDLGVASGDPAFGFGVSQPLTGKSPVRGDLDGAQARLPFDTAYSNLRFHPDFRVDQILFRELIGTVTDAIYLRPHTRLVMTDVLAGRLVLDLAAVMSFAMEKTSTPGQSRALGLEFDPSLAYISEDGFRVDLDYGLLLPLSGLDNLELGLPAKPAQLARLRLGYHF